MRFFNQVLRPTLGILFLIGASLVHAAPDKPAEKVDELERFLQTKGWLQQTVSQIGTSASDVVLSAMGFLGKPYQRGGSSFDTGFDCSGFVKALYEQTIGKVLPRSALEQASQTARIDSTDLQPGDLVFFNTMRRAFSHVGIYIGDGKFIHSPKPGAQIRIESMGLDYWKKRYDGARRVLLESNNPAAATAAP